MNPLTFGGSWTDDKLARVRRYLEAYMSILSKYPALVPTYVDAFAGTGYVDHASGSQSDQLPIIDFGVSGTELLEGSAALALGIKQPFARYVFIERSRKRAAELKELKSRFEALRDRIHIASEDANTYLQDWCANEDWSLRRAVVFLDPYGMQVEWNTVECLAKTGCVDLWYLFPLSAVNRLLTRDGKPRENWARTLTRIFGTPLWEAAFYPKRETATLFGPVTTRTKDADFESIASFVKSRLGSVFPRVAPNARVLRNEKNSPLFLLCFATASRKASTQKAALNIAEYVLNM